MRIASCFLFFALSFLPLQGEEEGSVAVEQEELAYPVPEGSPPQISSESYQRHFMETLGFILLILVLVVLVGYFLRRFTLNRPLLSNQRKNIKIIERRPLSQSTQLYMIQVGNQHFILAESKLEVRTIATLESLESKDTT
jgi:flagellar biogenesis protein FliO